MIFIKKLVLFFYRTISHSFWVLFGLLGFLCLMVIRLKFKIRLGKLVYMRIGHLAANTEIFLRRQSQHENSDKEIFIFLTGMPVNRQLLTMIKRKIFVVECPMLVRLYDSIKPCIPKSEIWIDLPFNTNEYKEFSYMPPQLSFIENEEKKGLMLLDSMGIKPDVSFVCFHARDKNYLDKIYKLKSHTLWSYHDYRDCDVDNYLLAAKYLASQKIYALRMGFIVEKKLSETTKYIIDYATNFRSDFGDIYLPAKCKFFLGNTAGNRLAAAIFNVPIAFANSVPFGDISMGKKDVFIPKKYWLKKDKRFLTFREIIAMGADWWLRSELYKQAGIEIIENTAEEILGLAKEINERVDNVWVGSQEDDNLQDRFRALFPLGHRCYDFPSRIGADFLRQNHELLD